MVCPHFGLHSGRRLRNTKVYPCKLTKSTWATMLFNTQAYTCSSTGPTWPHGFIIALTRRRPWTHPLVRGLHFQASRFSYGCRKIQTLRVLRNVTFACALFATGLC